MALGKAIVTTPIGAEGIGVENGKHLVIVDDEEGFVNAISSLVEDRKRFDELRQNAVDFVRKNFDNLGAARRLIDFYKMFV